MFMAPAALILTLSTQATAPSPVKLSEVAYDVVGTEPDGEWVELVNTGTETVSLDDLRVADEEQLGGAEAVLAFPPGQTLAPGGVVVIASSAAAFRAAHGFAPHFEIKASDDAVAQMTPDRSLGGTQFQLANTSDEVLLLNPAGFILDGVSWGRSTLLPDIVDAPPTGEGRTLTRELDEATGALRPWAVALPSASVVRMFPAPVQNPTPEPEPTPEEPTPEEPTPEEPTPEEPTPEEPTPEEPTPEEPTPEEPTPEEPTPEEPTPAPRGTTDDVVDDSVDSGGGVDIERREPFTGPILPETSGGCAAAPTTLWWAMVALLARRRRR